MGPVMPFSCPTVCVRGQAHGVPDHLKGFGTAIAGLRDMQWREPINYQWYSNLKEPEWEELFGVGLRQAVTQAVNVASGRAIDMYSGENRRSFSAAQRAKKWFLNSFPLLGG